MTRFEATGRLTDPFAIARALSARPGLVVLSSNRSGEHGRFSYVACDPVEIVHDLDPARGRSCPGSSEAAPWFVGIVPYEALRAERERKAWLPREEVRSEPFLSHIAWWRYDAVFVIDHETVSAWVIADDTRGARQLMDKIVHPAPAQAFRLQVVEDEAAEAHVDRVRQAIERIHAGELYQVNLARRLGLTLDGSPIDLAQALLDASPTPFGALLRTPEGHHVVCTSPELALNAAPSSDGCSFDRLCTDPIKGTRRRSADPEEDRRLAAELDEDPKEQAELAMILDVERNDLARVCAPGSVRVEQPPHVVTHETVHHRVARVSGRVRPGVSRHEVLASLLPSGSVTGAPKIRAMETIAELEPQRRGLYTGALGFLGRDGSMRLAMAIRCAVLGADGRGEYLVGGGIVADSDPERELAETRWKALQLDRVRSR